MNFQDTLKALFATCTISCFAVAQNGNTTLGTGAGGSLGSGGNNTLIGDTAGGAITSGFDNTIVGQRAGATHSSLTDTTLIGTRAGESNTGFDATFVGTDAGRVNNGIANTFLGELAGTNNTTGKNNTFVGQGAGQRNTTGSHNIFVGRDAGGGFGSGEITGGNNVVVGSDGSQETTHDGVTILSSIGPAGSELTTGFANSLIGAGAGRDIGAGVGNTCVGNNAGANLEHGDFNTFVGCQAGWDANRFNLTDRANRNTYLGFGTGQTNRSGEDNVGVGAFADVLGPGAATDRNRTTFLGASARAGSNDVTVIGFQANAMGENSIAIGSNVTAANANEVRIGNEAVTSIGGPVNWTALSDGRVKTDVRTNVPGLDFINRLRPVTYHIDAERAYALRGQSVPQHLADACKHKSDVRYTGFIAQDVHAAARAVDFDFSGVKVPENASTDAYGLRYAEFVVPLVAAVQELDAKFESQQALIDAQQAQLARCEEILAAFATEEAR